MKIFKHLRKLATSLAAASSVILVVPALAHHSYSIYDIDNKVSRTGVLKEIKFVQPHISMVVEAVCEDGTVETWKIASKSTGLWDRSGHDRDFAAVGDRITIIGWPARNGRTEMALSEVHSEKISMVIRDVVRQQGARDNLPDETVAPGSC